MNGLSIACLLVGVLAHLPPVMGVAGTAALQRLYGIQIVEPNLLLLMQHRGVLFAIIAILLLWSVFRSDIRVFAMLAGLLSTVSFIVLAWSMTDQNAAIARVVKVDWVVIAALLAGLINEVFFMKSTTG